MPCPDPDTVMKVILMRSFAAPSSPCAGMAELGFRESAWLALRGTVFERIGNDCHRIEYNKGSRLSRVVVP